MKTCAFAGIAGAPGLSAIFVSVLATAAASGSLEVTTSCITELPVTRSVARNDRGASDARPPVLEFENVTVIRRAVGSTDSIAADILLPPLPPNGAIGVGGGAAVRATAPADGHADVTVGGCEGATDDATVAVATADDGTEFGALASLGTSGLTAVPHEITSTAIRAGTRRVRTAFRRPAIRGAITGRSGPAAASDCRTYRRRSDSKSVRGSGQPARGTCPA